MIESSVIITFNLPHSSHSSYPNYFYLPSSSTYSSFPSFQRQPFSSTFNYHIVFHVSALPPPLFVHYFVSRIICFLVVCRGQLMGPLYHSLYIQRSTTFHMTSTRLRHRIIEAGRARIGIEWGETPEWSDAECSPKCVGK
jgi:hypothetical protein